MDGKQKALYKIYFVGRVVCPAGCVPKLVLQMMESDFKNALLILVQPLHIVPAQLGLHTLYCAVWLLECKAGVACLSSVGPTSVTNPSASCALSTASS